MSKVEDRIRWYRNILSEDPTSRIFVDLAEVLYQQCHWSDVIAICRKGLELHPQLTRARVLLGLALWETGEPEKAEGELQQVSAEFEKNAVAYKALAVISWETKRPGKACKFLDIYLHFHPHDEQARKLRRSWDEQLRFPPTIHGDHPAGDLTADGPSATQPPLEPNLAASATATESLTPVYSEDDEREQTEAGIEAEEGREESPGDTATWVNLEDGAEVRMEPPRQPGKAVLRFAVQWLDHLEDQVPPVSRKPLSFREEDRRGLKAILKATTT